MTTVTEIADTISKEFATAVRAAEANDRETLEDLIVQMRGVYSRFEAGVRACGELALNIEREQNRRRAAEAEVFHKFGKEFGALLDTLEQMKQAKETQPLIQGPNVRLLGRVK